MRIGAPKHRWHYYAYTRNILHRLPEATYVPVEDVFSLWARVGRLGNRIAQKITKRPHLFHFNANNQFFDAGLNAVDLFHFFNGISYGKRPWVTTFETAIPRFLEVMQALSTGELDIASWQAWRFRKAMEATASDACLGILPLSDSARRAQEVVLQWAAPEVSAAIRAKMRVLHPPQPALLNTYEEKPVFPLKNLRFILVGHDFFRKGGAEILDTFIKMHSQSPLPLELIIVSRLDGHDYATQADEAQIQQARQKIQTHAAWIKHFDVLPHQDVLALMRTAHVGLLPTYADSYGYSVLELQASGCPVITTNINALPEINAPDRGWIAPVPLEPLGNAPYHTPEGRAAISAAIRSGLQQALEEIFADPESILRKGAAALHYIRTHHDPEQHANVLREIYNSAF